MEARTRAAWTAISSSTLLLSAAAVALPAQAAPPPPVVYDALGDSYAAGSGVTPYEACGRSTTGAPAILLDGRMKIELDDFVACSGARTADTYAQVAQALDADTDLVTISMGGNDVAWIETVAACWLGTDLQCAEAVSYSEYLASVVLPAQLDAAYTAIEEAAPDAHVVVTGYPRFFTAGYGDWTATMNATGWTGTFTVAEQMELNDGADLLNSVIAGVAADHGFQFVDVTARFADHGVNAAGPWIGDFNSVSAFHPNLAGYQAYASALTSSISPRSLR